MTSLVRYRPYLPFQEIFDSFLVPRSESLGDYPTMDVMESEDEYLLTANMPGMAAEDISVEVEDGVVAISASVSSENESGNNGYVVRERKMGGFQRRLRMSSVLDGGKANAVLEKGVLTVRLPKASETKPRRIAVKVR